MLIKKVIRKVLFYREKAVWESNFISNNKYGVDLTEKEKRICKKIGITYSQYGILKNNVDADKYLTKYISDLDSYVPRYHNGRLMCISDNKFVFPYIFGNYFKVAHNYARIKNGNIYALDEDGLIGVDPIAFFKENEAVLKPEDGCDGKGIFSIIYDKDDNIFLINEEKVSEEDLPGKIKTLNNYLVQEKLKQGKYFSELYPGSVNTIRVVSARVGEGYEHEIICAAQRIGTNKSAPADNFSKGGLSAIVDIETGRLSKVTGAKTFDENGKRIFFEKHPDTGFQLEGTTVYKWDEIKSAIKRFTRLFPEFNFIAWDIFVDEKDNVAVVETNMKTTLGVFQVHGGLKGSLLDEVLQKMKEIK